MSRVQANGQTLEYEETGPADGPAIVLIMGLGMQLIAWPEPFWLGLAARVYRVIRFDNRDIGLSSEWSKRRLIGLRARFIAATLRLPVRPYYTLDDMVQDTLGLMDALKIERAHVVGASMGGMIAQILAARRPERVRSLTSMMSTSGRRGLPGPAKHIVRALARPRPKDLDQAIEFGVDLLRLIASPGYPTGETELREIVTRAVRRSYRPRGFARQLLAVAAAPSRVALLRSIRAPTLVLHGAADPLVPLPAGRNTADNIAGARLSVIPGWAHDLPAPLLPTLVEAIGAHCDAVERSQPGRTA